MKYTFLLILMFGTCALAEPPALPLPTFGEPVGKVARTCKGALVATLVSTGYPGDLDPPGCLGYDHSRWQVITSLRSSYPAEAKLQYRVRVRPEQLRQQAPIVGHKYILLSDDSMNDQIEDIFEYSDEKLQEIQQLLTAKPQ